MQAELWWTVVLMRVRMNNLRFIIERRGERLTMDIDEHFKEGSMRIRKAIKRLQMIVDESEGEGIECYDHSALDEPIEDLIEAKMLMAVAWELQKL